MCESNGGLEVRHAPPLCSSLKDAASLLDHVVEGLAEPDRQAARFLAIDVLAGLRREDRGRGVPAIAGGNEDRVDVGPRQQLAEVAVERTVSGSIVLVNKSLSRFPPAGLNVANGHTLAIGLLEYSPKVIGSARTDAYYSQSDAL